MKTLRIGVARFHFAAALAFILIAIALGTGRAEQVLPDTSGFSSEALARIRSYMRHEVPQLHAARGRGPQYSRRGAFDPAAWSAGAVRRLWREGHRQPASDDHGYHLSVLFVVEGGHVGCCHDAGRRRQIVAG